MLVCRRAVGDSIETKQTKVHRHVDQVQQLQTAVNELKVRLARHSLRC